MELITLIFLIGRILFGGYFLINGIDHLGKLGAMTQYVASKGTPLPRLATIFWALFILVAGASILTGVYGEWAVGLLSLFIIPVTFIMHAFWKEADPQARMMEKAQFMKNMALVGAGFMMVAIPAPWVFSL